MRKLHTDGFNGADSIIQGLAKLGYIVGPGDRVLDVGCGEGALVYQLRDLGYDARGFDIHNYVKLRNPGDDRLFKFLSNPKTHTTDMAVSASQYRLPFDDDVFDLVVSTQTVEHVLELSPFMSESARVLQPGGAALHIFPDRNTLLEPHFYVPLASRIQNWWWLYAWAVLGIRNEFQSEMTARQVADANYFYCQTGIKYLTDHEMRIVAQAYFEDVTLQPELYYERDTKPSPWHAIRAAISSDNPWAYFALRARQNVLLTARKRRVVATADRSEFIRLARPFTEWDGFAYSVELPGFAEQADTHSFPMRSTLVLYENGKALGPAHCVHGEIIAKGYGRYSHWNNSIVFSASDNTDPNWNDRLYTIAIR